LRVVLINPPRFNRIPVIREDRCEITERYSVLPPYSLLQIAAVLRRDGHYVELIDANGFNLDYDYLLQYLRKKKFDVVVFRFTPTTFDNDIKVAEIAKRVNPNTYTIGICWTLKDFAEQVLREAKYIDFYVARESEVVVPQLISALENKEEIRKVKGISYIEKESNKHVYTGPPPINWDWDELPLPAFDLLPSLKPYHINTPHGKPFSIIYAAKGCPFGCIFCTVARTKWRPKSADRIIEELVYLKKLFNIRLVSFFDETFTLNQERAIKIAETIKNKGLKIKWYCNTRVDLVDYDLWKTLYEGGCRGTSYGVESGCQKILDLAKKGFTVEQAENAIRFTKKASVKVFASFIFGLPGESWDTVRETISFVKRTLPTGAEFNIAVPYPGTELYEIAVKKGWIVREYHWRKLYQHTAVMRTDEMTLQDLEKARLMAYRSLYFNPKWVFSNVAWLFKHPEDIPLGLKYYMKALKNYVVHKMAHAH